MYYPVGWPKVLLANDVEDGKPVQILQHPRKELILVVREKSVSLWHTRLCSLVYCYKPQEQKDGVHTGALTSRDGTILVVTTSEGVLLFLKLHIGESSYHDMSLPLKKILYYQHDSTSARSTADALTATIEPVYRTAVVGGITSLTPIHNCITVSTGYGVLHRVLWDGQFDSHLTIKLKNIHFSADLTPQSKGQPISQEDVFARHVICSRELCGLVLVLSNGRAAFVASQSAHYEPSSLHGVWINCVDDATCAAINRKYKMVAFGRTSGAVTVASADEVTGVWSINHVLQLSSQQVADECHIGPVECMEWSQHDAMVIAVAWQQGGLSVWSVYGVLLYYSHGDQPGTPSPFSGTRCVVSSLCWSSDGYHIWMLRRSSGSRDAIGDHVNSKEDHEIRDSSHTLNKRDTNHDMEILVMQFVKNSIVNNPIISNHHHLFLQGPDRLYLHGSRGVVANGNSSNYTSSGPQWRIIQLPFSYLCANWPLKYAALDDNGQYMVAVGSAGFILYSIVKRKWRMFGNERQEQSITCTGGVAWWKHFVVFPCTVQGSNQEVRFYSLRTNLDHSQVVNVIKLTSPILKLNIFANCLLVLTRDCVLRLFSLELSQPTTTTQPDQENSNKRGAIIINKLQQFSLSRHIYNVQSLVAIIPSDLCAESGSHDLVDGCGHPELPESILINVSGRILMIQQDQTTSVEKGKPPKVKYSSPVCLASSVEALWTPLVGCTVSSGHLMESLWLGCGSNGVKVWLPLYPRDEGHPSFLSKRIMLTLDINSYTQAVLFEEAILLGLTHETAYHNVHFTANRSFPFATVERTTHIYLHHILRQLLRRNLGGHAFQIAQSCSHLPYFAHVLELMLHEVLEEEAPVALSVPDALLPRVVEFIKQFEQFPDTIGSCARKTEVALWQYLFAAVGSPRDLFETCIKQDKLKTAATYLVIIQNLETSVVSKQLATRLLETALEHSSWQLCNDLVRFLKAIGPGDSPVQTPLQLQPSGTPQKMSPSLNEDHKVLRPQFVLDLASKEEYFIDLILSRHARKLLLACKLRDLGRFAAHLNFNLPAWLSRERYRAACVDEYVSTLCTLHKELQWPFPTTTTRHRSRHSTGKRHTHSIMNSSSEATRRSDTRSQSHDLCDSSVSSSSTPNYERSPSSLQRANRPPDLNLTSSHVSLRSSSTSTVPERVRVPPHASTPEREITNQIQDISLSVQPINHSPTDSTANTESEWTSDDSLSGMLPPVSSSRKPHQGEKEIRYFVEVFLEGYGLEWACLLGILLLDPSVINSVLHKISSMPPPSLQRDVASRMLEGLKSLQSWAEEDCPGYVQFLETIMKCSHELDVVITSVPTPPTTAKSPDDTDVAMDTATLPDHTPHQSDSTATSTTVADNSGYCSIS